MKITFFREGTKYPYQGIPEPILMAGEVLPGFKIFADHVNRGKRAIADEAPVIVEELIVAEKEPEEDIAIPEVKTTDDQDEELDLEAYI